MIKQENAPIRNNVHIDINLSFSVQLSEDNNYLENAVNFLFDKSKHEIEEKVKQIMNEQVLLTLASFSVEEIFKNDRNDEFLQRIRSDADQRLKKVGLTTTNMECYWIYDDKEYYREVARRAVMEAVNSAKAVTCKKKGNRDTLFAVSRLFIPLRHSGIRNIVIICNSLKEDHGSVFSYSRINCAPSTFLPRQ